MTTTAQQRNEGISFLDIETVPASRWFKHIKPGFQEMFIKKHKSDIDSAHNPEDLIIPQQTYEDSCQEVWFDKAALYPEYGQIVCVSVSVFAGDTIRSKSFVNQDEYQLLIEVADYLRNKSVIYLNAFNGRGFDYPFMFRRMLYNNVEIPQKLNIAGKKPWEVTWLGDLMETLKLTDWKGAVSLRALALSIGLDDPKGEMSGAEVKDVFYDTTAPWEERAAKISKYCESDSTTLALAHDHIKRLMP